MGHRLSEVVRIVMVSLNASHDNVTLQDMISDEVILCVDVFEPRVECLVLRNLDASSVVHEDNWYMVPETKPS